jgi:hypothetical protein
MFPNPALRPQLALAANPETPRNIGKLIIRNHFRVGPPSARFNLLHNWGLSEVRRDKPACCWE